MNLNNLRMIFTALLGIVSSFGILPEQVVVLLRDNAEHVVGFILLVWSIFIFYRNRKERSNERP